ncbi:MAG: DUF4124 domain-containing protein [Nitrosomonas ureae]
MKSVFVWSLLLALVSATAEAQTYKCKTPAGKTEYSDSPCHSGSKFEAFRPSEAVSDSQRAQAEEVARRNRTGVASSEAQRRPVQTAPSRNSACDKLASGERSGRMGEVTALIAACNPSAIPAMMAPQKRSCSHAQDTDCVMTTHY